MGTVVVVSDADDAVLAANQAFYDAFETRSVGAMDEVWEHGDDVICVHPGWRALIGWADVRRSWINLLANEEHLQFILTEAEVLRRGEMAIVRGYENILLRGTPQGSVSVLNIFARQADGSWRMVAHHAAPVMPTR